MKYMCRRNSGAGGVCAGDAGKFESGACVGAGGGKFAFGVAKELGNWHYFGLILMFLGEVEFTGAIGAHGADGGNEFGGSRGGGGGGGGGGGDGEGGGVNLT